MDTAPTTSTEAILAQVLIRAVKEPSFGTAFLTDPKKGLEDPRLGLTPVQVEQILPGLQRTEQVSLLQYMAFIYWVLTMEVRPVKPPPPPPPPPPWPDFWLGDDVMIQLVSWVKTEIIREALRSAAKSKAKPAAKKGKKPAPRKGARKGTKKGKK